MSTTESTDATECPTCGDTFDSTRGMKCHHSAIHDESIAGELTTCDYCGDEIRQPEHKISGSDNTFCNQECYSGYQSENKTGESHPRWSQVESECPICGEVFSRPESKMSGSSTRLCSEECRAEWFSRSGVASGENHYQWSGGRHSVVCEICGEEYTVRPSVYEDRENRLCSPECVGEWISRNWTGENHPNYKRVALRCHTCGSKTELTPSVAEKVDRTFCSNECFLEWASNSRSGSANPNWKGGYGRYYGPNWRRQRTRAIRRDQARCRDCGIAESEHIKEHGKGLHVHHITPARCFNDPQKRNALSNLITLCEQCHLRKWEPVAPLRPDTQTVDS